MRRANQPEPDFHFRFSGYACVRLATVCRQLWRSLWRALWPRGRGPPGAQRARVPSRAAAIPRTAAAPSGSPRDGKAKRAAAYASMHACDKLLLVKSEGIQLCGTVGDGSLLKRETIFQLQNWTSKLKRGNQQLATNLSAPAG